jgi:hypothetical protein
VSQRFTRAWGFLAAVSAFILMVFGATYVFVNQQGADDNNPADGPERAGAPNKGDRHGFRDLADEVGITFRMRFLPGEQGDPYKVNLYDHGSGLAIGDFDGDGHDDIYFVNQLGPNALYKNKGDGTFVEVTQAAGVALGDRICVMATFADYDNDGRQDLFVTSVRGGNVLFRNLGNGRFKDVTKEAGLSHVGHSYAAVFFDYDNDGYLDLLVTNTAEWTMDQFDEVSKYFVGKHNLYELAGSPLEFNILYHNNRDGTFTDVTENSGLKGKGWAGDAAVFDYNGDGFLDVLVTNMFGASQLYRNNGNGTFTDVTRETLGRTPWGGMGAKVFSSTNDGRLDLYIVDMHSDMWIHPDFDIRRVEEKKKYAYVTGPASAETDPRFHRDEKGNAERLKVHYEEVVFGNTFFKALGGGKFQEVSDKVGLENFWPWNIATGDFDNDGHEDVFVPAGMGYPFNYWPNYLLMNNGNGTFSNRAETAGIEPPARGPYLGETIRNRPMVRSSRCAATADFDGDGCLEIVTNNFNDQPYYFRNQFPRKNYVAFRLRGTKSNRDAIGAVVRLYCGTEVLTRQVNPAGGYLAQSSKTVHFGLGGRTIDRVEIRWPSGLLQKLAAPELNRLHPIVEPEN